MKKTMFSSVVVMGRINIRCKVNIRRKVKALIVKGSTFLFRRLPSGAPGYRSFIQRPGGAAERETA